MRSKWSNIKPLAIKLRHDGHSLRSIERDLGIPRSTLSNWFKNVQLTNEQQKVLKEKWKNGLVQARKEAVKWHNRKKQERLDYAKQQAVKVIKQHNKDDLITLEIALAILYLGEGSKRNPETALGSSDPTILRFFIGCLVILYNFNMNKIRCELNLRADQNPEIEKIYWSKELCLPLENFRSISIDKRTLGSKTYKNYHGVCHLRCASVEIQRKLMYLSKLYCQEIGDKYCARSSAG